MLPKYCEVYLRTYHIEIEIRYHGKTVDMKMGLNIIKIISFVLMLDISQIHRMKTVQMKMETDMGRSMEEVRWTKMMKTCKMEMEV